MPSVVWSPDHRGRGPRFRCSACGVSFLGGGGGFPGGDHAIHAHGCPEAPHGYAACEAVVGPDCAAVAEKAGDGPVPGWGGLTAAEVIEARAEYARHTGNGGRGKD